MKEYNLTEKQQQGLDIAWNRFCNNEKYTIIARIRGNSEKVI